MHPDTILSSGKIATNGVPSFVEAVAIKDGKITAIGSNDEILRERGPATNVIDCGGRTVIPGLNDSHVFRRIHFSSNLCSRFICGTNGTCDPRRLIG
jgi:predicted amidohydrolase YtcJ